MGNRTRRTDNVGTETNTPGVSGALRARPRARSARVGDYRQWKGVTLARLAVVAVLAALLAPVTAAPASANHLPIDIDAHYDEVSEEAVPGGVMFHKMHIITQDDPVDFTAPITVTDPTPAGTTFVSVTGSFPLAPDGSVGGPPCAAPPVGGTGPVTCTGALGPDSGDDYEAFIIVRFRVDTGVAPGEDVIHSEMSAVVAGDPDPSDNEDDDFTDVIPGQVIHSPGPIDEITTTARLGCQAHHVGDEDNSFYPEDEAEGFCGTFLHVAGTNSLYGPNANAKAGIVTDEEFTFVSPQQLAGTGTIADPFTIVTVVDAGDSGIRVTQTDTYVVGQATWRTDVQLHNASGSSQTLQLWRAADCFLNDDDLGFGQLGPEPGAVSCTNEAGRALRWIPITPGSHYYEAYFRSVWDRIRAHAQFPDTCRCNERLDNGAGLSWVVDLADGGTTTLSYNPGIVVGTTSKTADQPTVAAGAADGYTVTVSNYGSTPIALSAITDTLPLGFTYTAGSTTGATTSDPTLAGGTLTWTGPFTVPAGTATSPGVITLHFGVLVSTTAGVYNNVAGAVSEVSEVTPTGPTASIKVIGSQAITFTSAPPVPATVGGSSMVTATGGGSGNPVVFSSATPGTCTVSPGGAVSFVGAGTCTINANQAGSDLYTAAPQVQQTFMIGKLAQTITFTSTAPSSPVVGTTYMVAATGGASGNPVTFSSATPGTCTVSGSTVSFVGVGPCTVNANQAGNANYEAAPQVQQSMTVIKASPTLATVASAGGPVGSTPVRDVATLSGGYNPTGTVLFKLFSNNACTTQVFTSTNNVSARSVTSAPDFTPVTVGTFYWTAAYGGDPSNNPATSGCQAPNESVVIVKATPTISTQASPANLLGGAVRDVATLGGGNSPTGNVTFKLYSNSGCTTEVFSVTNNLAGLVATSDWSVPQGLGTYYWTALYNGDPNNNSAFSACNAANESVAISPFAPPTPTRPPITGNFLGPLTVGSGESVLITGAQVVGPVIVQPGGSLSILNSKISKGVVVDNPKFLSICGSDISGPSPAQALGVSNATGPLRIGDPGASCAGNRFAGTVNLTANVATTTFGANQVSHATTVTGGGPGATVIKANVFFGTLSCTSNNPAPVNAGQPNTGPGAKTGQCAGL